MTNGCLDMYFNTKNMKINQIYSLFSVLFSLLPPSTKVIETSHSLDLLVDLEEHYAPGAPGDHQPRDVGIALG